MSHAALFLLTVLIWGSTWIAISIQAASVPVEVSVAYRFLAAAAVLLVWSIASGAPRPRLSAGSHLLVALQGLCLFCLNFVPVYEASRTLSSGLVAVGFSTVVLFGLAFGAIAGRRRVEPRLALGAATGIAGLALVYLPELRATALSADTLAAIALVVVGAAMGALGTVVSGANQRRGVPILTLNGLGMLYGGIASALYVTVSPIEWAWDPRPDYALSLAYLVLAGSIAGFWCFLSVVARIGPERACYIPVLVPVVALAISTLVEGYVWTAEAAVGVALVLAGNLVALAPARNRTPQPGVTMSGPSGARRIPVRRFLNG